MLIAFALWTVQSDPMEQLAEAIRARLDETRISIEVEEAPLGEVLDAVSLVTGITIHLDADVEVRLPQAARTITMVAEGRPAREFLRDLLWPRGLTLTVRRGRVVVVLRDELLPELVTRWYDVSMLRARVMGGAPEVDPYRGNPGEVELGPRANLVRLIRQFVAPETWDRPGREMHVIGIGAWRRRDDGSFFEAEHGGRERTGEMLVVTQSREVHDELDAFLGRLGEFFPRVPPPREP